MWPTWSNTQERLMKTKADPPTVAQHTPCLRDHLKWVIGIPKQPLTVSGAFHFIAQNMSTFRLIVNKIKAAQPALQNAGWWREFRCESPVWRYLCALLRPGCAAPPCLPAVWALSRSQSLAWNKTHPHDWTGYSGTRIFSNFQNVKQLLLWVQLPVSEYIILFEYFNL